MKWVLHPIVMTMAMEKWVSWQQMVVLTLQWQLKTLEAVIAISV